MDDKKREERIARAQEIFTYCMESDDPRLDEIVWIEPLPLRNSTATRVHAFSEPFSVRKAILATLFDFPECINEDTRIVHEKGIDYYEGKSKFITPLDCTEEQQTQIEEVRRNLEVVSRQLGDSVISGQKGNVALKVNLWLDIEDINFDNIVEWLNFYCGKNTYSIGNRLTELVYVPVSKEALQRAGIEISDFRWRKIVDENDRIGSRDIVEAVEIREIPESIKTKTTLKDIIKRIDEFFYNKKIERDQIRFGKMTAKRNAMLERDRWDHYV